MPATELIELIWGDNPPDTARKTLQSHLSRLRTTIGTDHIRSNGGDYALIDAELDVRDFESAIDKARIAIDNDPAAALDDARHAVELWRGEPLTDLGDGSATTAERVRLASRRAAAQDLAAEALLRSGDPDAAVAELERLVTVDALREHRWALLVEALYATGRQADALRTYQHARTHLADELGIEPGPELRAIETQVLTQDPALAVASRRASSRPTQAAGSHDVGVFVFTDIEDSTRLWAADADAMSAAIARHDEILEDVFARFEAEVFARAGDSYAARFDDAAVAVEAAREIQTGLGVEPWPEPTPIRVRIGIHAGKAERRADNWFGPTLNTASRVMAAGHGGQLLITSSVAELAPTLDAPSRGTLELRGLPEPVEIREVVVDPAVSFPPLRIDSDHVRLPTFTTELFGRDNDVAELTRQLATHRLVSVVGLGGMGKTRLAVAAAERFRDHTPDGVVFVDLQAVDHPDNVPAAVVTAIGLQTLGDDTVANLEAHVAPRRILLVLDNCEHVIDAAADLANTFHHAGPAVHVLATSRERLDIEGEHVFAMRALPTGPGSPAERLFLDRASHLIADFAPTDDDLAAINELVGHLDGLPLAIELAAGRVTVLSPPELLANIEDRFRLLGGGRRRRASKERTLKAMLDWSFELLEPDEQDLLPRLAVFPATFDAAAVAAVAEVDDLTAIDLLDALTAKSLVAPAPDHTVDSRRFRLLEKVRAYADDLLAQDPALMERVRSLHSQHFLVRGEGTHARTARHLSRLAPEVANLLAAVDFLDDSSDLHPAARLLVPAAGICFLLAMFEEALPRLDRLIAKRDELDRDVAAELLTIRGATHLGRMNTMAAAVDLHDASSLAVSPHASSDALHWLSLLNVGAPDAIVDRPSVHSILDERQSMLESIPADDELRDHHAMGVAAIRCLDHLRWSEFDEVFEVSASALHAHPGEASGWGFMVSGASAYALCALDRADEAIAVLDEYPSWVAGYALNDVVRAIATATRGDVDDAYVQLRTAAEAALRSNNPMRANDVLIGLAATLMTHDEPEEARRLVRAVRGLGSNNLPILIASRIAEALGIDDEVAHGAALLASPDAQLPLRVLARDDLLRTELEAGLLSKPA